MFARKSLFLSVFVSLVVISSFVSAAGVDVSVTPSQAEGFSGSATKYAVIIKNMENKADQFLLSYSGTFSSWVTLEKSSVVIPAGGEETVYLSVNPPVGINPSVYRYVVRADSANDATIFDTAEFFFTVYFKYPLVIRDFKLDNSAYNPGTDINAVIKVANLAVTDLEGFSLEITITDPLNRQTGLTVPVGVGGLEEKTVQKPIALDKHAMAGDYKASARLRSQSGEQVSQNQTSFVVNTYYNVLQTKDEQKTSSGKTVTIKLSNEGNLVGRNITVREDLSSVVSWLASPDTKPNYTTSSGGDVSYFWAVDELTPGETASFVYRISYTPAYVILAFLVVGSVVVLIQLQKPRIYKRVLHSGPAQIGREFAVTVIVKNSSRNTLNAAVVRDLIPPVMKLLPHHDTLKPLVKKTAVGTEMIWKIGDVKPQEERIITYKLSPVMGVLGTVSLPKAYLRYRDANENSMRVDSNYAELGEVARVKRDE
ncbi:MAG: DUF11 domain-containing protein [Candidatus Aenigmarchaeota archaeon]|nr:DUF11 domain-containing protein [Candidatus Aenigmarchaeota archaeon]